jgi:hypothetical protein
VTTYVFNRALPYTHQYSFDIQRELFGSMLVEVGYGGNTTRRLSTTTYSLNYIPANEMGKVTATGAVDTAYYTGQVPNPMAGLIPNNASLNGATIQRQILWRAYPQFSSLTLASIPIGQQQYHGVNFKVTKRMSHGLSFLASYTIGKNLQKIRSLNPQDFGGPNNYDATTMIKEPYQDADTPEKFVIAGVYELPFGRGKQFARDAAKVVDHIIGGWQLNYNITYQSGWVVDYPNAPQVTAGSAKLDNPTSAQVFNTSLWMTSSGKMTSAPNTTYGFRTWPYYFSNVRRPGYQNWDTSLTKFFPIHESLKLQFRFEMVNMMNHPWFADMLSTDVTSASFGRLNPTQRNLPRFIKLAMHLNFCPYLPGWPGLSGHPFLSRELPVIDWAQEVVVPRIVGVFSLLLVSCLACLGQSGPAINPLVAPAPESPRVLPDHVKLVDQYSTSRKAAAPLRGGWDNAVRIAGADRRCGHIVVFPVTPEIDPGMVLRLPRSSRDRMPTMKTMPPCQPSRP